ncbi:type II secretion system F family protein [Actinoplanes sp. NPDC049548]|uniref:type II secretion system F family protein n=1 Tax=Actinoplanes sp. NPDC049548 TaxID=3155152 RepID=UPI0034493FA3
MKKQEPAAVRAARISAQADLPLSADLLAAALRAGTPVDGAVSAVAEALGGPLGERLARIARSLRLGADPPEAWAHLTGLPGRPSGGLPSGLSDGSFGGRSAGFPGGLPTGPSAGFPGGLPGAERLVAAAVRSSASGGALAGAFTRIADDLRADRAVAAEAAARRAGVLIVLPLGLCFLPAFLLAGLFPVLIAVLGDVL